jgi:hypothetical protein
MDTVEKTTREKLEAEGKLPKSAPERKFKEITTSEKPAEYGEFFKWTHLGQTVEGRYYAKRLNPARTGEDGAKFKEQTLYDIREDAGGLFTLNGNFDLQAKMKKVKLNSYIRITWEGEEDVGSDNAGLSARRIFKVEVSE